jgi:3-hydroxyisobutyrate dehydrogenase/2-hydroxy-3-oxopropionate reductase
MTDVAVLGLGAIGSRMAARLLEAGHDVVVWNRTAQRATPLVERGARRAATPGQAVELADAVITMLASPDALADVTEGPDGIAAATSPATVIEMSTVGPAAIARLRSALPEAFGLLDAPVQGSIDEAAGGSLRIWVGGEAAEAERWMPLLSALGTPTHVGPLGAGASAKLVTNSTLLGVLGVLGEALALAEGLGLEREVALEILRATPLAEQVERRRPALQGGVDPPRFVLSLARKDGDLIRDAAEGRGLDLRVAQAAWSWFQEAEAGGLGDRDYSSVLTWIVERATGRRADGPSPAPD